MIIGLMGLKNSGKDSLVKLLQKEKGIKVYNLKFARGIKDLLENYFDIPSAVYECPTLKEKKLTHVNKSARELMIELGTYFRKLDKNCWVNYINNHLNNLGTYDSVEDVDKVFYIFTDVRFENEIDYIQEMGGIIIDVSRDDLYVEEKRIIKKYGANCLTRFCMRFINKSLVPDSEWLYWKNRKRAKYNIDNTDLKKGYEYLKFLLKVD